MWIFKVYFLFQRTPSLVSSRMMPCSSSCSRIWSARAKFFAFLAVRARCDQRFDLGVERSRLVCTVGCEHVENGIEAGQKFQRRGARLPARNSPASMALLASRTYSNTARQRFGGVQIVVQAVGEACAALRPCAPRAAR